MTHRIWRNGRAAFRYRLPPELRAIAKPRHWPPELSELVSETKPQQLKHELSKTLGTRDERTAKREAAKLVGWAEGLVAEAQRFIKHGPPRSLSKTDIEALAASYGASLISGDLDLRKEGIGLDFSVGSKLRIGPPPPRQPGLTNDDLGLLKFVVDRMGPELREGMARQRVPEHVREAVNAALGEAGIDLAPHAPERRELELAFLEQRLKALQVTDGRNRGEIITNPAALQKSSSGPTVQEALDAWKTGVGARGEKVPSAGAVEEAAYVIRRFREQFGNLRVTEITSAQAKSFRDALVCIPPRLPQRLQRLPLPKLLEHRELPQLKPAATTVNKKLQLISAIMNAAAKRFDLKMRPGGWTDPFEGLKLTAAERAAQRRASFSIDDLNLIVSQHFIVEGDTTEGGGKGLAARWMPLIGLFTGARRREIAQLKIGDLQFEGEIPFFRITDLGEEQSVKNVKSIRRVPLHPELIKCGFLNFVRDREAASGQNDWLFEGLKTNRKVFVCHESDPQKGTREYRQVQVGKALNRMGGGTVKRWPTHYTDPTLPKEKVLRWFPASEGKVLRELGEKAEEAMESTQVASGELNEGRPPRHNLRPRQVEEESLFRVRYPKSFRMSYQGLPVLIRFKATRRTRVAEGGKVMYRDMKAWAHLDGIHSAAFVHLIEWHLSHRIDQIDFDLEMDELSQESSDLASVLSGNWDYYDLSLDHPVLEFRTAWVHRGTPHGLVWKVASELMKQREQHYSILVLKAFPLEYQHIAPEGSPLRRMLIKRRRAMMEHYRKVLGVSALKGEDGAKGWMWKLLDGHVRESTED